MLLVAVILENTTVSTTGVGPPDNEGKLEDAGLFTGIKKRITCFLSVYRTSFLCQENLKVFQAGYAVGFNSVYITVLETYRLHCIQYSINRTGYCAVQNSGLKGVPLEYLFTVSCRNDQVHPSSDTSHEAVPVVPHIHPSVVQPLGLYNIYHHARDFARPMPSRMNADHWQSRVK